MESNKKTVLRCSVCCELDSFLYHTKNSQKIYKCNFCKSLFVYPVPSNLDSFYSENYFYKKENDTSHGYSSYDNDKEPMKNVFIKEIERYESLVVERKIFDVGAATGYFLDIAKASGWKTYGSEISAFACNTSIDRGHSMYYDSLLNYDVDKFNLMSVVTMWDVFEHVEDPVGYLKKTYSILDSGGILAINTIDAQSFWARVWGKKWNMIIPPEHLFYYSKQGLNNMLKSAGFEILLNKRLTKKFSLTYIFGTLYLWQGFKLWRGLANFFDKSFWRQINISINVRDNIYIVARKK